ncbi:hypothetical protein [Ramlibacter alkalitolerans]|uniref:Uncharacterized protein n=1 Tax=Ramlibacter alkalitolerans TaxID=2039631 RepID=A0ABS1JVQ1_9BURK|nr:hypothetical protein [Ramlibacter alkalitolerans]MBL0428211.1 hypothetical protein [Ramlibacter alkalitolerans]
MKSLLRPGPLVGVLAAVLLVLTGVAAYSLLRLGSGLLALSVALTGVVAVAGVALAWSLAREAEQELGDLLPPLPVEPLPVQPLPALPARKRAFRVREARPGEVPEAYLAAVRKGAQAREAAWKENTRPSDPHVS